MLRLTGRLAIRLDILAPLSCAETAAAAAVGPGAEMGLESTPGGPVARVDADLVLGNSWFTNPCSSCKVGIFLGPPAVKL